MSLGRVSIVDTIAPAAGRLFETAATHFAFRGARRALFQMGAILSRAGPPIEAAQDNKRVMKNWRSHQEMANAQLHLASMVTATNFSWNHDVKPAASATVTVTGADLAPIWVDQMKAGATHAGRQLSGTVIETAVYTGGIYFVLEDAVGNYIKVGVYNIPDASAATASHLFKSSTIVTILEPYFKVGVDYLAFVRVDDPVSDLRVDTSLPEDDSAAWQQEGKQFFAISAHRAAIDCWDRALFFSQAKTPIATLMTKCAPHTSNMCV